MITRAQAQERDAADPLAGFRAEFTITDPDLRYLDGNSLGRLPAATPDFVADVVRRGWGDGLVRSWGDWVGWTRRLGDRIAEHVVGARPGEVVVADSTSVNLYKLAAAALASAPDRAVVVVDAEDFPTDRYIAQGLAEATGGRVRSIASDLDGGPTPDAIAAALDDNTALLVLSLVSYRSGAVQDMAAVNRVAADAGVLVLWDLSHAAGAVPVDLRGSGADLAVGCTYKYLNGGPGSPAFLYVREELQERLRQPIWGWFGQRDQFDMGADHAPAAGIDRFLVGTPPLLSLAALDPALDIVARAGVDRLREKGMRLGELVVDLADEWLAPFGFRLASPRAAADRGSHVTLAHPEAWRVCQAAIRRGVVCDHRVPDRLRIGPAPLYTRHTDVWDAMDTLRRIMADGEYTTVPRERSRVT